MITRQLWFLVALLAATSGGWGCSSSRGDGGTLVDGEVTDGNTAETADVGDVGGAACGWPSSLASLASGASAARPDGSAGQCVAARAYLSCAGSRGDTHLCLSDNTTECPAAGSVVGETFGNCHNLCRPDEYAVACGGPGPGPWPSPPAQCRTLPPGPGGGSTACCPCGSADADGAAAAGVDEVFDCGDAMTCDASSQFCQHVSGGVAPGVDIYSCRETPPECPGGLSCACVQAALRNRGAVSCVAKGNQITVLINVP